MWPKRSPGRPAAPLRDRLARLDYHEGAWGDMSPHWKDIDEWLRARPVSAQRSDKPMADPDFDDLVDDYLEADDREERSAILEEIEDLGYDVRDLEDALAEREADDRQIDSLDDFFDAYDLADAFDYYDVEVSPDYEES